MSRPHGELPPLTGAPPVAHQAWTQLHGDDATPAAGAVVEEVPVALVYGSRAHVVVMATPADLEDLAVGFTVTERIVSRPADVHGVAVERHARGIECRVGVPAGDAERLAGRARAMPARTGCGLCGVEAIADAVRPPVAVASPLVVEPHALYAAARALGERQPMNREAHALHAAAWAHPDGAIAVVREDVGRHNAVDKVIGALVRAGTDPGQGMLVVTSRASVELVQKAAVAGIPVLAAISRPTALAVRLADACGMALVALVRGESANLHAGGHRVAGPLAAHR
jgi:FdhD protein